MVFQNYALFPHMTVAENVAFPLAVRGIGKAERDSADRAARSTWSAWRHLGGRMPAQLSGRPAAAGGARPGARLQSAAGADGRAARRARQAAARAHADRDQAPARAARRDLRLCHPRPGRGADHVRPDRRVQRRPGPAARAAGATSTKAPPTAFVARFIGENNRIEGKVETVEGGRAVVATKAGERFACAAPPGLGAGQDVMLSIRPEAVRLSAPGAGRRAGAHRARSSIMATTSACISRRRRRDHRGQGAGAEGRGPVDRRRCRDRLGCRGRKSACHVVTPVAQLGPDHF